MTNFDAMTRSPEALAYRPVSALSESIWLLFRKPVRISFLQKKYCQNEKEPADCNQTDSRPITTKIISQED